MASILVLEDEDSVNRGIEFSLSREGYEVSSAKCIQEGWELFLAHPFEMIICDINLPDGNGLDFIRKVREKSNVYIICLTALDQEFDQVMGYEAGADDYVTKPFSLSVLLLKVNVFFKRTEKKRAELLESGEWSFSIDEMTAKRRDSEENIEFTKNEWKMLKLFLDNPKQILSKNQILQGIFDLDGEFVDENTVAVNIRRLREKIDENPGKPEYIRNVRGLGYIWNKECIKR